MTRRAPVLVLCALLGLGAMLCPRAIAQPAPSAAEPVLRLAGPASEGASGDVLLESAELGWDGFAPPAAHIPLRMTLSSGARAFSGEVELSYVQNLSHSVRLLTSVSTTPGRVTRVDVPVSFAEGWGGVSVRITLREGGRSASTTVEAAASRSPEVLRAFVEPLDVSTLALADDNSRLWAISEAADALPTAWISYESLSLLAAREETLLAAPPAVRDAILAWVHAGGHLLLVLDQAGSRWTELAPADAAGAVRVLDQTPVPAPVGVVQSELALEQLAEDDGTLVRELEVWSVRARPLELTAQGAARGWSLTPAFIVHDDAGGDSVVPQSAPARGLVASGSAGLGRLTLVGGDPATFPRTLNAQRTGRIWLHVIRAVDPRTQSDSTLANVPPWLAMQGMGETQSVATAQTVDPLLRVPRVRRWVLVGFACVVMVIAVLVGPVGQRVLHRRRRASEGWKLGLAGSLVATLIGLGVPRLTREQLADGVIVRVLDAEVDAAGTLLAGPAETRIGAFITAAPRAVDVQGGKAPLDGAWWRTLSARQGWSSGSGTGGVPLVLRAGVGEAGKMRASEPLSLRLGQASLGIVAMDAPRAADDGIVPRVRVERLSDDALSLRLDGLEGGMHVQALVTAEGRSWAGSGNADERGSIVLEPDSPTSPISVTHLSPWGLQPDGPISGAGSIGMAMVRNTRLQQRASVPGTALVSLIVGDVGAEGPRADDDAGRDRIGSPREVRGLRVLAPVRDRRAMPAGEGEGS